MNEYEIQKQFARHKELIHERQKERLIAAASGQVVSLRPAKRQPRLLTFFVWLYNLRKHLYNRPPAVKTPPKVKPVLKS